MIPDIPNILLISLSNYLHGTPVEATISSTWSKHATPAQRDAFDNHGFNLDPKNKEENLSELGRTLQETAWDGVMLGWCVRGNKQWTVLFEELVGLCLTELGRRQKAGQESFKLMFCEGPEDLVVATLRNFSDDILNRGEYRSYRTTETLPCASS